jgi:hypothetical protein
MVEKLLEEDPLLTGCTTQEACSFLRCGESNIYRQRHLNRLRVTGSRIPPGGRGRANVLVYASPQAAVVIWKNNLDYQINHRKSATVVQPLWYHKYVHSNGPLPVVDSGAPATPPARRAQSEVQQVGEVSSKTLTYKDLPIGAVFKVTGEKADSRYKDYFRVKRTYSPHALLWGTGTENVFLSRGYPMLEEDPVEKVADSVIDWIRKGYISRAESAGNGERVLAAARAATTSIQKTLDDYRDNTNRKMAFSEAKAKSLQDTLNAYKAQADLRSAEVVKLRKVEKAYNNVVAQLLPAE